MKRFWGPNHYPVLRNGRSRMGGCSDLGVGVTATFLTDPCPTAGRVRESQLGLTSSRSHARGHFLPLMRPKNEAGRFAVLSAGVMVQTATKRF